MTFTASTMKRLLALNLPKEIFDEVLSIMEDAKRKVPKKGDAADRLTRGTRLQDDWRLPKSWGEYALSEGLRESEVRREAEKFGNYWRSQPGQKGIKLDWERTWRNWALSAAERLGRAPIPPAGPSIATTYTSDHWRRILRIYASTSNWRSEYGPAPGMPGCQVPADLLPLPPQSRSAEKSSSKTENTPCRLP